MDLRFSLERVYATLLVNLKTKSLFALPFALLLPIKLQFTALFLLILIDTISGATLAIKMQSFSSSRFRESAFKVFTYSLIIIASRLLEFIIEPFYQTLYLTLFIIGVLAITELSSILENLIGLGVPLPKKEILHLIVKKIRYKDLDKYLDYTTQRGIIERDIDMLLTKYTKLVQDEHLREALEIKFKVWNNSVIRAILRLTECTDMEVCKTKIHLMIKQATQETRDACKSNAKVYKAFDDWAKSHKSHILNLLKNIDAILDSDKYNTQEKKLKIAEIITQALYKSVNEILISEG